MKILFNTYPIAFDTPGGGEIQLLKTKVALELLGQRVELYDQWNPQLTSFQIAHYFSVFGGSSIFCNFVKNKKIPLAISSVLFPHKNTEQYPMAEISNLLKMCDVILPNSIMEAQLLADVFDVPIEKFSHVYNGVDDIFLEEPEISPEIFRSHFGIQEKFLLNVANIESRKNQLMLSRALAKTDYTLVIFGNIRDHHYYKQMQLESNGKIKYLGYLPNHSPLLRSAYSACELFVLPSLLETPGLAALEAAAVGAKVAVTGVGSTKEYFQDFVEYFDPEDEHSFLATIEKALSAPRSLSLKKHIARNFTWHKAGLQTLAAYRKVF